MVYFKIFTSVALVQASPESEDFDISYQGLRARMRSAAPYLCEQQDEWHSYINLLRLKSFDMQDAKQAHASCVKLDGLVEWLNSECYCGDWFCACKCKKNGEHELALSSWSTGTTFDSNLAKYTLCTGDDKNAGAGPCLKLPKGNNTEVTAYVKVDEPRSYWTGEYCWCASTAVGICESACKEQSVVDLLTYVKDPAAKTKDVSSEEELTVKKSDVTEKNSIVRPETSAQTNSIISSPNLGFGCGGNSTLCACSCSYESDADKTIVGQSFSFERNGVNGAGDLCTGDYGFGQQYGKNGPCPKVLSNGVSSAAVRPSNWELHQFHTSCEEARELQGHPSCNEQCSQNANVTKVLDLLHYEPSTKVTESLKV